MDQYLLATRRLSNNNLFLSAQANAKNKQLWLPMEQFHNKAKYDDGEGKKHNESDLDGKLIKEV
jgi:hypothetical protein